MPNQMFRGRIHSYIEAAINQYHEASLINHPNMVGQIREIAAKQIIEPLLPEDFKIANRGKVTDHEGHQSSEIDLLIYSMKKLPSIIYGDMASASIPLVPAEACFYAIEVKGRLTKEDIRKSNKNAKNLREGIVYISGQYDAEDREIQHQVNIVVPILFAFESDAEGDPAKEFERIKTTCTEDVGGIYFIAVCIIGKGYWWLGSGADPRWMFHSPTNYYDEVIDLVSGIINSLHKSDSTRGFPRLGRYLILPNRGTAI